MTLIVAVSDPKTGSKFVAGDKRLYDTDSTLYVDSESKVFSTCCDNLILGISGYTSVAYELTRIMQEETEYLEDPDRGLVIVKDALLSFTGSGHPGDSNPNNFDEPPFSLLAIKSTDCRIFQVAGSGSTYPLSVPHFAIGIASDFALGCLAGMNSIKQSDYRAQRTQILDNIFKCTSNWFASISPSYTVEEINE